jgi:predicted unusual protein kinase regulating ubiquinone biosynthesis (AarF/ABC1/UbiB family)
MQLGRIAEISKIFIEEGLGFLTESREPTPAEPEPEPEPKPDDAPVDPDDAPAEGEAALAKRETSDAELARRLRRTLERLGPTFVKFGQMLATRVDLFSAEFVDELAKLHSDVAPYPTPEARAIIEDELGRPLDEIFEEFPDAPIAAASIAQVYRARLRERGEHDHGWVAVKVQRPGLEDSLLRDLDVLIDISKLIDRIVPMYRRSMVHKVAEEYVRRARDELDFLDEAKAIDQFADVLATLPEFRAPAVRHELCSPRLLVMEWLDGTKLGDVPGPEQLTALGFDPKTFARSMLRLQISMAYEHGFVHGDTHPGNIILLRTGYVGLIDFGLHGHVPRALRDKMLELLFYQAGGRHHEAVEAFVKIFRPDPAADIETFKRELMAVLEQDAGRSLKDARITEGLVKGMRVGARYHLEAPSALFMVLRNLAIVEGIVLRYCPDIDTDAEMETIVGDIMRRKVFGPSMREEMTQLLPQLLLNISQRPLLAERLLQLERSFVASSSLGEFLRSEQVLQEQRPAPHGAGLLVVVALLGLLLGALGTYALMH